VERSLKPQNLFEKRILNKYQDKIDEVKKDVRVKTNVFLKEKINFIFRWFILIIIYMM
jgi:hypothetical protein